jgi:hypothetical protein
MAIPRYRGSVPAVRLGDASSVILAGLKRKFTDLDGAALMSLQGAPPTTPAFQQDVSYSPAGDFFGIFANGHGLRLRSRARTLIAALIASQLLFACNWAIAKEPEKIRHTARIISEVDVDNTSPAIWCYDTEPAFCIQQGPNGLSI